MTELEPIRRSLLRTASFRAGEMVAQAQADATSTLAAADQTASRIIETARAEGRRVAESRGLSDLVVAERTARSMILEARDAVEVEARARAMAAATSFRDDPDYSRLLDTLEADARRRLGGSAAIERDPPVVGGVRARLARRSLDYTLPSLVEHGVKTALVERERSPVTAASPVKTTT
jgi:hypothetical protein